jgi:hypothetical protein
MGEITDEIKQYKYQMIGTAALILSVIFGLIGWTIAAYSTIVYVLFLDLYLTFKKQQTITRWFRRQFNSWTDKIIMSLLLVLIIHSCGWPAGLWFLIGTINGHLSWEK